MSNEILQGNAKIAEFMEWESKVPDHWELPIMFPHHLLTSTYSKALRCKTNDLAFDKSWDWLMPVVEKIREILKATNNKGVFDEYFKDDKNWFTVFFPESIEILFKEVVEFIDWYTLNVTPS